MRGLDQVAAVVPVFNPEPGLLPLCRRLTEVFGLVVVVDDGSTERHEDFNALPKGVVLLRHETNRGKGRAIKTALAHLMRNRPEIAVAVFVDGDGQHRIEDVTAVVRRALEGDAVTFGVRDFGVAGVPFRSWWGNRWTAIEVKLFFGLDVTDTQTGLRAVPSRLFGALSQLRGERFEYEARIFRWLARTSEPLAEVAIRTVYAPGNGTSHFRPILDTLRTQCALFCPW